MKPGGHVAADRRVREVQLEHAYLSTWSTSAERPVDLDRGDTRGSAVVGVGVDMGETGEDAAARCVESLVLGPLGEARPVVGEHNPAGRVPQPEAQQVPMSPGSGRQPPQTVTLGAAAVAEPVPFEQRLHGRLRLKSGLGEPLPPVPAGPLLHGSFGPERTRAPEPGRGLSRRTSRAR
jgi:hypothetical protein